MQLSRIYEVVEFQRLILHYEIFILPVREVCGVRG
jgi:hypothetical protein